MLLLSCFSRVPLWDPIDGGPPGSPIPGILQARTLEWAAISFSNAWKWKVKVKSLSCVWLSSTPWTAAYQVPPSMGFSRQEYWSKVPLPSPLLNITVSKMPKRFSFILKKKKIFPVMGNLLWPNNSVTCPLQPLCLLYLFLGFCCGCFLIFTELWKEMATHSSILACRIPWTEESGRLQSMGLQESDMT